MIIDVVWFLLSSKIEMQFCSKNKKTSKKHKIFWNKVKDYSEERDKATPSIWTPKVPPNARFYSFLLKHKVWWDE